MMLILFLFKYFPESNFLEIKQISAITPTLTCALTIHNMYEVFFLTFAYSKMRFYNAFLFLVDLTNSFSTSKNTSKAYDNKKLNL